MSRLLQKVVHLLPILLFGCALYIVHKQIQVHDLSDILLHLEAMPMRIVLASVLLTILNYIVLAAYDWLALRYTGHKNITIPKMMAAALLSYAISNNTGHAWAAGGSIRYRFYSKWGVPGWDILKISLFQTLTYLLGALTLGLVGSLLLPYYLSSTTQVPEPIHWVSFVCLAALVGYWGAVALWRKPILLKGFELSLPSLSMAAWQTVISSLDVVLSSLVLWVLLLNKIDIDFGAFVVVFVVAQVVGVLSQVPGGIGVFESAFLWLMSDIQSTDHHLILVGALLLYRVIYYFMPLLIAGISLLGYEIYSRKDLIAVGGSAVYHVLLTFVPQLYSLLLLLAGALLLVSGSIPTDPELLEPLRDIVSLPVLELSHLSGSLVGVLLLLLARGIWLKLDAAWFGSLGLLLVGMLASLLKGFDWQEALLLLVIFCLMLPTRSYFQRRSSLLRMSFSRPWLLIVTMVIVGSVWLGFFAYRDVGFSQELWWQFSYEGSAPRFLRALLLMTVLIVAYSLFRLLGVAPPQSRLKPTEAELQEARQILMKSTDTEGFLVLLGDKYLFWNPQRTAFIMYATTSQFWIAMGDPVGEPEAIEELLYQFLEQADHYGAKIVFYQATTEWLPAYLDLGLSLFKLGEEAKVDLTTFTLQGKHRESQRSARNKFNRLGYGFEILSGVAVADVMPVLREISDAWLLNKNTREKGFSLGFFEESYVSNTDVAVVKDEQGQIKAFANVWHTHEHEVITIDLMRYNPDSPSGIMDFLFAELMLWGKDKNYQWFSLGMAPLAGLESRPLAPLWHKVGATIFKMGEHFYNFEGLYEYKAKFAPHWESRYLVAPAGLSVPFILMQITRLISGGWQGIFSK
jgi:phosphatidylglycerol lysyltransferase